MHKKKYNKDFINAIEVLYVNRLIFNMVHAGTYISYNICAIFQQGKT